MTPMDLDYELIKNLALASWMCDYLPRQGLELAPVRLKGSQKSG
jgi:hypothetical protein